MTTAVTMTVDQAIAVALKECKNPYALAYLQSMAQAEAEGGEHGKKVQVMYAVSNMAGWRGDVAREVKKVLRAYAA